MRVRDAHDLIKSEKNDFRYRRNRGYTLPKVKRAMDRMMTSFFVSCIKTSPISQPQWIGYCRSGLFCGNLCGYTFSIFIETFCVLPVKMSKNGWNASENAWSTTVLPFLKCERYLPELKLAWSLQRSLLLFCGNGLQTPVSAQHTHTTARRRIISLRPIHRN